MTKFAFWIAALGVSALGSSAANAQSMTLTSSDIKEGGTIVNEQVFKGFGCTGGNVSPALSWGGAPSGTKSFAVTKLIFVGVLGFYIFTLLTRQCRTTGDQSEARGSDLLWRLGEMERRCENARGC